MKEMVGRQVGRIFIGDKYTSTFYRMVVILLFIRVFIPEIPNVVFLFLIPIWIAFVWGVGYIVDKSKLDKKQAKKTYEQTVEGNVLVTKELYDKVIIPKLDCLFAKYFKKIE